MEAWFLMGTVRWLLLFIVLLAIEIATVSLTTIWFAGGALAGLAVCLLGGSWWMQMIAFLAVSLVLLIFTRPFAMRYINQGRTKTNVDGMIGEQAVVTEEVDNLRGSGKVKLKGMDWTARTEEAGVRIAAGSVVTVQKVEGVKVIVKEKE